MPPRSFSFRERQADPSLEQRLVLLLDSRTNKFAG